MGIGGVPAVLLQPGAGHKLGCVCKVRSCVAGEFSLRQPVFCFQRIWFGGSGVKLQLSTASETKVPPRNLPSQVVSQEPKHMISF